MSGESLRPNKPLTRLVVILSALNLFLFVANVGGVIAFPFSLDYGEGPIADQARRIAAGEVLYKADLSQPPYVIANYPPLYPALIAWLSGILPAMELQIGRLISVLAAAFSGLIAGLIAGRISGRRLSMLLAASLLLSCAIVLYWAPLARIDMLALALSLTGLWLIFTRWQSWSWFAAGTACLVAAIFTRQAYLLAAPLAGFTWLWRRERRRAIIFAGLLTAAVLSLAFLLNLATGGGFYLHTVIANVNPYRAAYGLRIASNFLRLWPLAIILALLQIILPLLAGRRRPAEEVCASEDLELLWHGLLPYTVGGLLVALTVAKIGSNLNYFLELSVAVAIWCALAIGCWPDRSKMLRSAMSILLVGQLAWATAVSLLIFQNKVIVPWSQHARYETILQEVELATMSGKVLADEALYMIVQAGQRLYLQPFEYNQLYQADLWDPAPLAEQIGQQDFPLILIEDAGSTLYEERWPAPLRAAIETNYRPVEQIGNTTLYRPN